MLGGDYKMDAKKIQIQCGVENCHHNKSCMCNADALAVNAMGDGNAETSDGTCCTTFINKK